ncbi:MAG: hypothetical protein RLZZ450_6775 [Pseudomonadota bacterium]
MQHARQGLFRRTRAHHGDAIGQGARPCSPKGMGNPASLQTFGQTRASPDGATYEVADADRARCSYFPPSLCCDGFPLELVWVVSCHSVTAVTALVAVSAAFPPLPLFMYVDIRL